MKKSIGLLVLIALFVAAPAFAEQKQAKPVSRPQLHNTNPTGDRDVARGRNQHRLDYNRRHGIHSTPVAAVRG
jgi:hypothetical protein